MAFFNVEFPTAISYGASGGPVFNTYINTGFSGFEHRNRNWSLALAKFELQLFNKPTSYFNSVYNFWMAVGGRADAFRFKWAADFQATTTYIGTGDGATKAFQLQKTYSVGGRNYIRIVTKPITSTIAKFDGTYCSDSISMYVGGTLNTAWTVDANTGIVTFTSAPATSAVITSTFQFHIPVRFDVDELKAVVEESDVAGGDAHITWPAVQLFEVRA